MSLLQDFQYLGQYLMLIRGMEFGGTQQIEFGKIKEYYLEYFNSNKFLINKFLINICNYKIINNSFI
jgi:hypothetical protein